MRPQLPQSPTLCFAIRVLGSGISILLQRFNVGTVLCRGSLSLKAPTGDDLRGFDTHAGDLCLSRGCVACRGVQKHEDQSDHVYLYANISLDMRETHRPQTVD